MEIAITEYKHCHLVKVDGRMDSATAPQLADTFNSIMKSGRYRIILDLAGLEYISSSGLRILINTQKMCRRYNRGELVLACVPSKIYSALDLAGFTQFFKLFDDITTAVGNF
jgi:anti-sigma B factor antagonist